MDSDRFSVSVLTADVRYLKSTAKGMQSFAAAILPEDILNDPRSAGQPPAAALSDHDHLKFPFSLNSF